MRSIGAAALPFGLAALLYGLLSTDPGPAHAQSAEAPGMVTVTVEVELSCPSCARGLERRLGRLDHVAGVDVRPAAGRVVLAVEPGGHLDLAAVWDTVRNAGFLPDGMVLAALGHLVRAGGAPALALAPDFALPLAVADPDAARLAEAGDRLLAVSGRWEPAPGGPGRLQVESLEIRP